MNISWGVYSITLLVGSVQGLVIAQLLLLTPVNRAANRALALLILAVVLLITPYTLGFAGFYDRFRWLNFAPFYWELAFGPLVWLYVRQLGHRRLPVGWGWHFVPAALQGGYYSCVWLFVPTALKESYNDSFHMQWVVPTLWAARYTSYLVYAVAIARAFREYQTWLGNNSGQREEYRLSWLERILWVVAAALMLQAGYTLYGLAVVQVGYAGEFPLYVVFALLVWVLGIEGWRNAAKPYPKMDEAADAPDVGVESLHTPFWPDLADRWLARIEHEGWWREPNLSLSEVSRRLGTNTAYLSRALNEGAGTNFSTCINRMRLAAARERLGDADTGVLDVGLEVGFASKTSFNRVFKTETGLTPSAWRRRHRSGRPKS